MVFQSHFGSIGAKDSPERHLQLVAISIPLWFDWGPPGRTHPDHRPGFQSHFGSIGAQQQQHRAAQANRISIPLWFDWGPLIA